MMQPCVSITIYFHARYHSLFGIGKKRGEWHARDYKISVALELRLKRGNNT